jgi:hypothetical protein
MCTAYLGILLRRRSVALHLSSQAACSVHTTGCHARSAPIGWSRSFPVTGSTAVRVSPRLRVLALQRRCWGGSTVGKNAETVLQRSRASLVAECLSAVRTQGHQKTHSRTLRGAQRFLLQHAKFLIRCVHRHTGRV